MPSEEQERDGRVEHHELGALRRVADAYDPKKKLVYMFDVDTGEIYEIRSVEKWIPSSPRH